MKSQVQINSKAKEVYASDSHLMLNLWLLLQCALTECIRDDISCAIGFWILALPSLLLRSPTFGNYITDLGWKVQASLKWSGLFRCSRNWANSWIYRSVLHHWVVCMNCPWRSRTEQQKVRQLLVAYGSCKVGKRRNWLLMADTMFREERTPGSSASCCVLPMCVVVLPSALPRGRSLPSAEKRCLQREMNIPPERELFSLCSDVCQTKGLSWPPTLKGKGTWILHACVLWISLTRKDAII